MSCIEKNSIKSYSQTHMAAHPPAVKPHPVTYKSKPQHPTSSTHWNEVKEHKTQKYILETSTRRPEIQETGVRLRKG